MIAEDISFGELEKKIYEYACQMARDITYSIFKVFDKDIMKSRDIGRYRLKDSIQTTIKTLYGDVVYKRRYYYDNVTGGYVFLLDDMLEIRKSGLFSLNMAELIVNECANESYRKAAEDISRATAQAVSSVGAWRIVQKIEKSIEADEEQNISDMKRGIHTGARKVRILFQEADGIWLNMQENRNRAPKQELKLATVYEGWKDSKRHELIRKKVIAGMETGKSFMVRREAFVRSVYNLDEIDIKLLNGDGAAWIDSKTDGFTYKQLDQYHLHQEITRRIQDKKIRRMVMEKLHEKDIDKMLKYVMMYADSIDNGDKKDKQADDVRELYRYLNNNRSGLLKYKDMIMLPDQEPGTVYRNMGVQEGQNCTLITMRMKHRRMRWSVAGANNLAKVICSRSNGDLEKYIAKEYDGVIPLKMLEKAEPEILSAAAIPDTVGEGDKYMELIRASAPVLNAAASPANHIIRSILNRY